MRLFIHTDCTVEAIIINQSIFGIQVNDEHNFVQACITIRVTHEIKQICKLRELSKIILNNKVNKTMKSERKAE